MYQKELDQVPLQHKTEATRKRILTYMGDGRSKKNEWFHFPWQILHCRFAKPQSNSLW